MTDPKKTDDEIEIEALESVDDAPADAAPAPAVSAPVAPPPPLPRSALRAPSGAVRPPPVLPRRPAPGVPHPLPGSAAPKPGEPVAPGSAVEHRPPPLPMPRGAGPLRGPSPLPPRTPFRAPTPAIPVARPSLGTTPPLARPPLPASRPVAPRPPADAAPPLEPIELEGLDFDLPPPPAVTPSTAPTSMRPATSAAPPPSREPEVSALTGGRLDELMFEESDALAAIEALQPSVAPEPLPPPPPEAVRPLAPTEPRDIGGFLDFGDLALADEEIEPAAPVSAAPPPLSPDASEPEASDADEAPAQDVALTSVDASKAVHAPEEPAVVVGADDDALDLSWEEASAPEVASPAEAEEPAGDIELALDDVASDDVAVVSEAEDEVVVVDDDGPAMSLDGDEDRDGDEDSVLLLEDESEVDLGPQGPAQDDRGAMLAAAVTSRRKGIEGLDRMFAADARAEARARAEMLVEEAADCASYTRAAEWLSVAADLYEGVLADRGRARQLADQARALAPECVLAIRVLRRIALFEGDLAGALSLCDEELTQPLGAEESQQVLLLAAELSARVRPAETAGYWARLVDAQGVLGPLARLFAGAASHDEAEVLASLEAWASQSAGGLAASINVARARRVEGVEGDAAIRAIRDAVARDNTDAGAWLSMARIGFARVNAALFQEALQGLARSGEGGALAVAAKALGRALGAVLGEAVDDAAVEDAGVAGWLVAHAQRDAEVDPSTQVRRGLAGPEAGRAQWALWAQDEAPGDDALGRFKALRQASRAGDVGGVAAFVGGDASGLVEAALRAAHGAVTAEEAEAFARSARSDRWLLGALRASGGDLDDVDALWSDDAAAGRPLGQLERAERALRGGRVEEALAMLDAEAGADTVAGLAQLRLRARVAPSSEAGAAALWSEARAAGDERRAAGQRMVGAALAARATVAGAGAAARWAAERLPGDHAAAELAALYALRGDIEPSAGAELLGRAASGEGTARRVAEVRAALRRATEDADGAAEMLWAAWQRLPRDASLGALVLRATPGPSERSVTVLRSLADGCYAAGPEAAGAAVAVGLLLAAALEELGRFDEAAQAVARARTQSLGDTTLEAAEERLWLRAGMFAEVAERAFDQLKAAASDEACIVAYEKLAELDRTYRSDVASSVLSFQAILELAPGHMASLRTLERYFTEQGRTQELLGIYDRLVRYADDPVDALAFAHAGARLAEREGDGEPEVASEFLRVVLARDVFDRRLLLGLDAETRRLGDLEGFAGIQARLAALASDDLERSTALLRAGEAFEALGDSSRAREAYESAAALETAHVGVLRAVAEARLAAGETVSAAEALEAAGRAHRVIAHGVEALHRAAVLWRGAGDTARALAVAEEALQRDPRHADCFALAVALRTAGGDTAGELKLLEARLEAEAEGGDGAQLAAWHARAAEIAQASGDAERARGHWRSVVALEPERLDALRALVVLFPEAEDWAGAADAMIRLAKATPDPAERVEMLFGLGDVFERRLEDTRRAEAAWRRATQYAPEDRRILARLADLYAATSEPEREAETLVALIPRVALGAERTALQLRLAAVLESRLGDPARAEHALEAARREAPSSLTVLRALAQFHVRRGNPQASAALLDRAATELRRSLDRDPCNLDLLARLAEVLSLRGRTDGARVVASVGWAVAPSADAVPPVLRELTADGFVDGRGAAALRPGALDLLSPPAITGALREVLARVARVVDPLVPFDPRAWSAEPLGNRPHALRNEIDAWSARYGLGPVEVYLCGTLPERCLPVYRAPATVLLAADLGNDAAGRAAVARAMTLMALSLSLPLRMTQDEFSLCLAALFRQFEPMYKGNVDPARLDELARRMTRALPRDLHAETAPFAYEALNRGALDAEAIHAGALEFGDRVTLLASGDLEGALALLGGGRVAAKAVAEVPVAGRLVRVALSDRFLDARQIADAEPPATPA